MEHIDTEIKIAKIYSNFYKRFIGESPEYDERIIRGKIKAAFPNAYALLSPERDGQRKLIYRLPVIGGINELTIGSNTMERPATDEIIATVISAGILGNRINRDLRKTLARIGFEADHQIPLELEISDEELLRHKQRQFSIKEADKNVTSIMQDIQNPYSTAMCLDAINSDDLGFYLEMRMNKLSDEKNIKVFANYDSKFKKLEVMKF